jgi:hypothetical protein
MHFLALGKECFRTGALNGEVTPFRERRTTPFVTQKGNKNGKKSIEPI